MFMKFRFDSATLRIFLALDCILIALHTGYGLAALVMPGVHWPDALNIGRDWSIGEIGNYAKWILIIFALLTTYIRYRTPAVLGLAGFFAICLLDDSLQLHKQGGTWLVDRFHLERYVSTPGFIGELVVWAALGTIGLAILGAGWFATEAKMRRDTVPALFLFGAVLFCAIFVDLLHASVEDKGVMAGILGIAEDGGEMIALTFLLSYVWSVFFKDESHELSEA